MIGSKYIWHTKQEIQLYSTSYRIFDIFNRAERVPCQTDQKPPCREDFPAVVDLVRFQAEDESLPLNFLPFQIQSFYILQGKLCLTALSKIFHFRKFLGTNCSIEFSVVLKEVKKLSLNIIKTKICCSELSRNNFSPKY